LEFGSVCYSGMGQYRRIRIALGLMCLTPNNSLGVLSGIAPLAERFICLNFRYLDHVLKRRLETLRELNLGRCTAGYSDVLPLNVVSSESHNTICRRSWLPILWVRGSHGEGTRSSDNYVCGGGSPRAVDGDS
jgi:hypothetical protein